MKPSAENPSSVCDYNVEKDMSKAGDIVWIAWERHRRTRVLSNEIGAKLYEFDLRGHRIWRYLRLTPLTLMTLVKERPAVLVVQNPSILLAAMAVAYRKTIPTQLIVDSHSEGVKPFDSRISLFNAIAKYIQRGADITIVTNPDFKLMVDRNGGKGFVLPDKIPELTPSDRRIQLRGMHNILFICTFADDEPYREVVDAARDIGNEICVYVTGEVKNLPHDLLESAPSNLIFTGYLTEEDYVTLLFSVNAVMDLTTRDNCLVCGAYEALAAEKPLILSDKKALRDYFDQGVTYVDNTARGIKKGILEVLSNTSKLERETRELKKRRAKEWKETWRRLLHLMHKQVSP
jgi:glycosyltransferase involved in cell wall biosynthesis